MREYEAVPSLLHRPRAALSSQSTERGAPSDYAFVVARGHHRSSTQASSFEAVAQQRSTLGGSLISLVQYKTSATPRPCLAKRDLERVEREKTDAKHLNTPCLCLYERIQVTNIAWPPRT